MDAITPREAVLGSGAGGPLTAPTPWLQYPGYIAYVAGGVVAGIPSGGNKGPGSINLQTLYINGALVNLGNYLALTGGTLTGFLILNDDPTDPYGASTKKYVDNRITTVNGTFANYLPLSGGTLTGPLSLSADPATNLQAATKQYVDTKFTSIIAIPDAPSDGTTYGRKNGAWADTSIIDVGTF
jgi:hypothetical protein